jgi:Uma2 family endonuclease
MVQPLPALYPADPTAARTRSPAPYRIDPADPRAPSEAEWSQMSQAERDRVVAMLPAEVPLELYPPEGDDHRKAKTQATDTLETFFKRVGRKVYVSSELGVFYPGEARFAPDILAVLDVEAHSRTKWVVAHEGRGLDLVIEVHHLGSAAKDFDENVKRYARLGISEYFLFDRGKLSLRGYRLPPQGHARVYKPILPQQGRYVSEVLGLDLAVEGDKLRFLYGQAAILDSGELVAKLGTMLDEVITHKQEAEARAAELEEKLATSEEKLATSEEKLAAALAEIERLRGGG